MTWSYDSALPTDRDKVRREIGDTQTSDQQLADEEIDYTLTQRSSVLGAAILCCDLIISNYARQVSQSVGSVSVSYSDRLEHYRGLLGRLRMRGPAITPYCGGISVSEKQSVDDDTDRDAPAFKRDMFDRKS